MKTTGQDFRMGRRLIPVISIPKSWIVLFVLDFCLVAFAFAQEGSGAATASDGRPSMTELQNLGSHSTGNVVFDAIDIFVESGEEPLAAYQIEFLSESEGVIFVGVEGGGHPAFARAPYYDPAAMNNNRVILAAFNAGEDLPSGRVRVARVHVSMQQSPGSRRFQTTLMASATREGREIPADISIARSVRE